MLLFPRIELRGLPVNVAYQHPLPRWIACQDVCVIQSHVAKRLLPEVNLCRFVVMLELAYEIKSNSSTILS